MHIEFKKITLHNFMSFGSAELQFKDDGFIRVSGLNEDPLDNAGSNGSGKSSLWEAIVWAITGETIRGTKQVVNVNGEDGCYVDIEFYIDKTHYQLIRSKDHKVRKTNLQIFIDGNDASGKGIRDSEKLLQQYIPDLTASLLGSVIILGQGLPQKFTNNTPSGRKEVLEKLSKSDFMIEDLKERTSDRKLELTRELRSFEDKLVEQNAQKNLLKSQIDQSELSLSTLDSVKLQEEHDNLYIMKSDTENKLSEILSQNTRLCDDLTSAKDRETLLSSQQMSELNDAKINYEDLIKPHIARLNELKAELNVYNKEFIRITNIKDVCPTCGQKITNVHKPDTKEIEQNIQNVSKLIDELNLTLSRYNSEYESTINVIQNKYSKDKNELKTKTEELSREYFNTKSSIKVLEDDLNKVTSDLSDVDKKIAQLHSNIEFHKKIIMENHEKLAIVDKEIMYNIMQRDLTQSHLEVISKFDTCLKRDFRGYLLSTVINYIESRAKYYCRAIFDTDNISFGLDGNNIDICYTNKPYENLSGGEKQKIDLIIQFSIRDMLSNQLNFTSNILVLDEVFDGLDAIGCTKVIDMIASVSDIRNIFIVTHRKDLSIPSDKEMIVVKSPAGISEIRQ